MNKVAARTQTEDLSHYIGGARVSASPVHESENPSNTNEIVARFPDGGKADVDAAVEAARKAFPAWSDASPEVRSDCLDRVGEIILRRREELGRLLSREEGKTLPEGIGEVARAGRIFKYFAGEALRRHGQNLASTRPGVDVMTSREAIGVFGLITPWNFPIAIPAWKSAPALAFGNTVVIKPAGPTPATAAALADCIYEAGAPAGVFNLVLGRGSVGDAIVKHPGVDGISFTGSQATGAKVGAAAMARQARVQMEMGGKNPLVVLDDADLDRAVACALDGAFFATAPRCTASIRFASFSQTESVYQTSPFRTGGINIGNDIPATRKSISTRSLGIASFVLRAKLHTLNDPVMPSALLILPTSMPRCGNILLTTPSASHIAIRCEPFRYS